MHNIRNLNNTAERSDHHESGPKAVVMPLKDDILFPADVFATYLG